MNPSQNQSGVFITIEGPDGAGKTTQVQMLKERLIGDGLDVLVTREPGGTAIGEEIRNLLLNPVFKDMTVTCEALLYSAARAQLVAERIKPALDAGCIVVCDRFFDSSTVYQGYAGAEDPEMIKQVNFWATGKVAPDLTFLLNIDAEAGLERSRKKRQDNASGKKDRMEEKALDFHQRVQEGFIKLASWERERFHIIDASRGIDLIHESIWEVVRMELQKRVQITGGTNGV